MYICANCNKQFSEPDYRAEDFGWMTEIGWHSAYQYFPECPYCATDEIDFAEECSVCGNYFPKSELWLDDDLNFVCSECKSEVTELDLTEDEDNES